jgi:hypothetical protein
MKYGQEVIERYENLLEQAKMIDREISELKAQFIASNGGESDSHLIAIKDNFREIVAGKSEFEKKFGATWLRDNGLLKVSAFNTVVIARKSAVKAG